MKFFRNFLRDRVYAIIWGITAIIVCGVVFWLYGIQSEALLYSVLLCTVMGLAVRVTYRLLYLRVGGALNTLISICVGIAVYAVLVLALKAITIEEIERLPKGRKIAALLRRAEFRKPNPPQIAALTLALVAVLSWLCCGDLRTSFLGAGRYDGLLTTLNLTQHLL